MALRALIMDYGGVLTEPGMLDLVERSHAAGRATALVSDAVAVPASCTVPFDLVVLGSSLGVRKPDPEVYRRVAHILGVGPQDCVVVDDLHVNLRGARAAGAVVVHHDDDPAATITEVEILLGLS